jgi:hypothetical protein
VFPIDFPTRLIQRSGVGGKAASFAPAIDPRTTMQDELCSGLLRETSECLDIGSKKNTLS